MVFIGIAFRAILTPTHTHSHPLTYTHPNRKRESAIPTVAALMNETNATLLCKGCKIILQYYPHFVVHIFTNYMLLLLPRIGIVRAVI